MNNKRTEHPENVTSESHRKKRKAGRTALIGVGFMVLCFMLAAIPWERPTTQIEALLPGLLIGLAGWTAIILFIIAIVQAILNR